MDPSNLPPQHFSNPYNPAQYPSLPPLNDHNPYSQDQLAQPLIGQQPQYPQYPPHYQNQTGQPLAVEPYYPHLQYGQPNQMPNSDNSLEIQRAFGELKRLDQRLENVLYYVWCSFILIVSGIGILYCIAILTYMPLPILFFVKTLLLMIGIKSKNKHQVRCVFWFNVILLVIIAIPLFVGILALFGDVSVRGGILALFLIAVSVPLAIILTINLFIGNSVLNNLKRREGIIAALGFNTYLNNYNI